MVRPVKLMLSRKVSKKCSDLHMESITSRNFEKVLTLNFDNQFKGIPPSELWWFILKMHNNIVEILPLIQNSLCHWFGQESVIYYMHIKQLVLDNDHKIIKLI